MHGWVVKIIYIHTPTTQAPLCHALSPSSLYTSLSGVVRLGQIEALQVSSLQIVKVFSGHRMRAWVSTCVCVCGWECVRMYIYIYICIYNPFRLILQGWLCLSLLTLLPLLRGRALAPAVALAPVLSFAPAAFAVAPAFAPALALTPALALALLLLMLPDLLLLLLSLSCSRFRSLTVL